MTSGAHRSSASRKARSAIRPASRSIQKLVSVTQRRRKASVLLGELCQEFAQGPPQQLGCARIRDEVFGNELQDEPLEPRGLFGRESVSRLPAMPALGAEETKEAVRAFPG